MVGLLSHCGVSFDISSYPNSQPTSPPSDIYIPGNGIGAQCANKCKNETIKFKPQINLISVDYMERVDVQDTILQPSEIL